MIIKDINRWINLSNISWERKLLSQIWLSMNNAIINAACIITQYGSMQKIGFSFILFLIFVFYVIKGKAALELEGVLVSGCEFACMLCVGWIAIVSRQIRLANFKITKMIPLANRMLQQAKKKNIYIYFLFLFWLLIDLHRDRIVLARIAMHRRIYYFSRPYHYLINS